MITRRVKVQLVAFTTMALVASALIFFHYTHIPSLMGIGQTRFEVDFPEGGGLYPHANVTYRGVTVGKVRSMELTPDGAKAELTVATSAHVPRDVTATIKSVSAIGEQYVDLVPKADAGSDLMRSGDTVPVADSKVPVPIATVLDRVDTLLTSVPRNNLTTVLDEADRGFRGIGPDLLRLNTNVQALIRDADANYPQTHRLLTDAGPVLDTQLRSSNETRAWAANLNKFTDQLRASDPALRQMLKDVPPAADQVSGLLDDLSARAPQLIGSADVSAHLLKAYYPSLEQVLSVYPLVAAADIASDAPDRGRQFRLSFKSIVNYPGGCSTGWPQQGQRYGPRPSYVISDEMSAPNAYCRIPQGDPRVARGARNLQCFEPGSPAGRRAALITQCRGGGYTQNAPAFSDTLVQNPLAPSATALLQLFAPPSGSTRTVSRPRSWTGLMLTGVSR